MGIETQAILSGHLTINDICSLLRSECGITVHEVHAMRSPDYKVIEFYNQARNLQAINVFLNSYAANDYAAVYSGASTLVTMEFSPDNSALTAKLAQIVGGFSQRIGGDVWISARVNA